jgi:hypothetical protein
MLNELADESPDRPLQAGVNLRKSVGQNELDGLVQDHELEWLNIYWDSPAGVNGAISRSVGAQSLNALSEGAAAYYMTVEALAASELKELAEEEVVYLVDVGRIDDLDEATVSGACVRFALPDPLWYEAQRLNVSLE